jgi:hypothetical protein
MGEEATGGGELASSPIVKVRIAALIESVILKIKLTLE